MVGLLHSSSKQAEYSLLGRSWVKAYRLLLRLNGGNPKRSMRLGRSLLAALRAASSHKVPIKATTKHQPSATFKFNRVFSAGNEFRMSPGGASRRQHLQRTDPDPIKKHLWKFLPTAQIL